jgi:hypothetical protein
MYIKTNRDIKSSIDVVRNQKVPSMISKIEGRLKVELEKEFGLILTSEEISKIFQTENKGKAKQDIALKKSRLKIMEMKEKIKQTQNIRQELIREEITQHTKEGYGVRLTSKIGGSSNKREHPKFKKINIGY